MARNGNTSTFGKFILRVSLMIFVAACGIAWEFILNPGNNYSVEIREQVGLVSGLDCRGDELHWRFSILETWRRSSRNYARLLIWTETGGSATRITEVEVREKGSLAFETCEGEMVNVAYIWGINSWEEYIHLRVHQPYLITTSTEIEVPPRQEVE